MKNTFSFEIYQEVSAADASIEPIVSGIQNLRRYIGDVDIVQNDALLRLPGKESDSLDIKDYRIKHMADFVIILTTKALIIDQGETVTANGYAYAMPNDKPLGSRVVIVSTHNAGHIEGTTEHEIGHTFNMAIGGKTHDGHGHCLNDECAMQAGKSIESQVKNHYDIDSNGQKYVANQELIARILRTYPFCYDCETHFANNAQTLMDAKQGKSVPKEKLFAMNYINSK